MMLFGKGKQLLKQIEELIIQKEALLKEKEALLKEKEALLIEELAKKESLLKEKNSLLIERDYLVDQNDILAKLLLANEIIVRTEHLRQCPPYWGGPREDYVEFCTEEKMSVQELKTMNGFHMKDNYVYFGDEKARTFFEQGSIVFVKTDYSRSWRNLDTYVR